jgi:peptide chain release factor 1
MEDTQYEEVEIHKSEVRTEYTRGTGPGGQHKNKTNSCVILTHYATGIKVKVDGRNQHKNEADAWKELTRRVNHFYKTGEDEKEWEIRKDQIGIGGRGDKRRTYRVKSGEVVDHISGKRTKLKLITRGKVELLH